MPPKNVQFQPVHIFVVVLCFTPIQQRIVMDSEDYSEMATKNQVHVPRRLIPASEWDQYHPWPTKGALRQLVHASESNGFDKVVRRANGRILIDEAEFFRWVEEQDRETKARTS